MALVTKKEVVVILLAPAAAGPGLFVSGLFADPSYIINREWWLNLIQPVANILITYIFALIGMLTLGAPGYYLLKHFNVNNILLVSLLGAPLGYVAALAFGETYPLWM